MWMNITWTVFLGETPSEELTAEELDYSGELGK